MKIRVIIDFEMNKATDSRADKAFELIDPDGMRLAFVDSYDEAYSIIESSINETGIYEFEIDQI